ncbi:MAG: hypothetical protein HYX90_10215 [Chloroflexi bacterium]|nr:hypothetical protein [Chloroflexota bacterium]
MTLTPDVHISCLLAAAPAVPPKDGQDLMLTGEQVLRLAEVRNALLAHLNHLNSPSLALQKLAEFKNDIAVKGIDEALAKWAIPTAPAR